jgi:predicted phage baseplate assembly protein
LSTHDDGTRAFTRRGYVRIAGPRDSVAVAGLGKEARALHWLRCRLVSGRYAIGQEPVVELFRYNTVEATSLTSVTDEVAGQSDGRTGQVVRLRFRPVLPGSVSVSIVPPPGQVAQDDARWKVVPDLVTSGPTDRHLVVDGSRGELRFGDGQNGQVPLAGFDVMVSYRYGGASLANVARDSITGLQTAAPGVDSVTNLRPAVGGADEESPATLLRHAPSRLRSLERAVTAEDYRQLALRVGGVADAVALERWNPDYPGIDIPGCITVVILPDSADPRPYASPELLDAVREVLRPARTIGAELFVRSARFVEVTVKVIVDVDPYAAFEEIRAEVANRLDDELAPTSADGESRFGRDFFPTTLFGVVKSVPGVIAVRLLEVAVQGDTQTAPHPPVSDPVVVGADQLIVAGPQHDIRVQPRRDL